MRLTQTPACDFNNTCVAVTHLIVAFVLHILPVHLHQSVSVAQPGKVSRGVGLHFSDELSASVALPVQVEPIAALPYGQEAEPGSQLALHSTQTKEKSVQSDSGE